jgi:hypothetical protein
MSIIAAFIGSFLAFTLFFVLMMLRPKKKKQPVMICAFCEAVYPTKEQMQEHIRTCPKHPLSRYTAPESPEAKKEGA